MFLQVNNSVRQIDTDFRYLLDRLHQKDLYDTTNMLIVSDHGFADINGQVYLDDCIKNKLNFELESRCFSFGLNLIRENILFYWVALWTACK